MEELTFVFARLKGLLLTEMKAGRAVEDLAEAVKKSIPGSLGAGVSLIDEQGRKGSTALIHNGRSIGALKVCSPLASAFSGQDRKQLALLASPAATLLGSAQPDTAPAAATRALQEALGTRDLIHTARGILMERHGLDAEQAMRRMLSEASATKTDLRVIAHSVLDGTAGSSH